MPEVVLNIAGATDNEVRDLETPLRRILDEKSVRIIRNRGFTGLQEISAILSLENSVIITEVAAIIALWLKVRSEKTVQIGDIVIRGVSEEGILKVLKEVMQKEVPHHDDSDT